MDTTTMTESTTAGQTGTNGQPTTTKETRKAARRERRATRNGITASIAALLALVALAVGTGGGFLLARPHTPPSLVSSTKATTITVASAPFDDTRSVALTVSLGSSATVTSPVAGTVTRLAVGAGSTLTSGGVAFDVDATPVLALHTDTPLYRTLTSGTQGADAAALNTALRRLGYNAPDSDRMTWNTIAAYNALAKSVGASQLTRDGNWAIGPDRFVWLPADTVTVNQIMTAVGRQVTAGADLLTTAAMPVKATLPTNGGDTVAGDRVITIGEQQFPIPSGTTELTDPTLLAAIAGSTQFRLASLDGGSGGAVGLVSGSVAGSGGTSTGGTGEGGTLNVSYDWKLANALTVLTVPPSAIYAASGGKACVSVDAKPVPVTIIASQLGRTMVAADDADGFDHVDVTPRTTEACRTTTDGR
ncbi:hypothetical protein JS528_01560 [Bifidobacterium sp. MA2]|uniref:Peptidoglycan-binding domain 1 protein n=1 Tax=Bifidobacterium santillanense TaxID=2809028 RepID=A0ABS5UMC3_9BIFI|nr:hypothetical protein [Bifidobacterium santillanense]MBT1172068.1 hypothetical protein [Bifidobacterium santillanense]